MTNTTTAPPAATTVITNKKQIVKGNNVSGRSWKTKPQKRSSNLVNNETNKVKTTWEKKREQKLQLQLIKQKEREMKEETRQEKIDAKERRLEQEKRKAENEFKNASKNAQTMNTKYVGLKMKAMNKKQLRQIKKTRMNVKTGVVEYAPAYAK